MSANKNSGISDFWNTSGKYRMYHTEGEKNLQLYLRSRVTHIRQCLGRGHVYRSHTMEKCSKLKFVKLPYITHSQLNES